jgi:hypothetical protein
VQDILLLASQQLTIPTNVEKRYMSRNHHAGTAMEAIVAMEESQEEIEANNMRTSATNPSI